MSERHHPMCRPAKVVYDRFKNFTKKQKISFCLKFPGNVGNFESHQFVIFRLRLRIFLILILPPMVREKNGPGKMQESIGDQVNV